MVLSIGILAVLISLAGMAMTRSADAYQATTQLTMLEVHTRRAMDRVIEEMQTAVAGTLSPLSADWAADELAFRQAFGLAGTTLLLGPPTRIRLDVDDGLLVLVRNEGQANEVRAVLCRDVPALLEGETANGLDDNGNGLVDEPGFSVTREGDTLIVRLSSQQRDPHGHLLSCTVRTSIALRN